MGGSERVLLENKKTVPPFPLLFFPIREAVGALTLYMGVRNRPYRMRRTGIKMPTIIKRQVSQPHVF